MLQVSGLPILFQSGELVTFSCWISVRLNLNPNDVQLTFCIPHTPGDLQHSLEQRGSLRHRSLLHRPGPSHLADLRTPGGELRQPPAVRAALPNLVSAQRATTESIFCRLVGWAWPDTRLAEAEDDPVWGGLISCYFDIFLCRPFWYPRAADVWDIKKIWILLRGVPATHTHVTANSLFNSLCTWGKGACGGQ